MISLSALWFMASAMAAPGDHAGLVLWLDGSNIHGDGTNPTDGSLVATWSDLSGAGNHATAPAGAQPTYDAAGLNGMGALDWGQDNDDRMSTPSTADFANSESTVFLVTTEPDAVGRFSLAPGVGPDVLAEEMLIFDHRIYHHTASGVYAYKGHQVQVDFPYVHTAFFGTAVTDVTSRISRIDTIGELQLTSSPSPFNTVDRAAFIGARAGNVVSENFAGLIAEIVVYDRALTESERDDVEAYLIDKYDIIVPGEPATPSDDLLRVLLPLYNYPNHYDPPSYIWDDVAAAADAGTVPVTAIVNASNGPGVGGPNADYLVGLADVGSSVDLIGYVYTQYGTRSIADVHADIDQWARHWSAHGVRGIFVDEMSTDPADLAYYKAVYDYIHLQPELDLVIGNPGTTPDEAYATMPVADVLIQFENEGASWASHTPAPWTTGHPASSFGAILHSVPTEAEMEDILLDAVSRNYGWIYVTDDLLPNPFDTIPPYFPAELSYASTLNNADPSSIPVLPMPLLLLLGAGLAGAGATLSKED